MGALSPLQGGGSERGAKSGDACEAQEIRRRSGERTAAFSFDSCRFRWVVRDGAKAVEGDGTFGALLAGRAGRRGLGVCDVQREEAGVMMQDGERRYTQWRGDKEKRNEKGLDVKPTDGRLRMAMELAMTDGEGH